MEKSIKGWPQFPIPDGVKTLIEDFFELLDIESDEAAKQWSNLFATDGEMIIDARDGLHVQGRKGTVVCRYSSIPIDLYRSALAVERKNSWRLLQSRHHSTSKIYTHREDGTELMIWGSNDVVMRNGVAFSQEFAQCFQLVLHDDKYYIVLFKSFIVSANDSSLWPTIWTSGNMICDLGFRAPAEGDYCDLRCCLQPRERYNRTSQCSWTLPG